MKKMRVIIKIMTVVLICMVELCSGWSNWVVKAVEMSGELPELFIKAVNPGYTVDGNNNVGEMIEIARKDSDTTMLLAGITVRYTNSSGNNSALFEFPENSYLTGESILFRLASSPDSELASTTYSKTLAMKGGLALMRGDEIIDELCWTGKEGCYKEFVSSKPTTLLRNVETGEFEHVKEYEPNYDSEAYRVEKSEIIEIVETEGYGMGATSQCKGLEFSEILSYYETSKTEQFVEFYNMGSEQILLDGCYIRYKNKNYGLTGIVKPEEYYLYYPTGFSLTKNPTNANTLELIDADGKKIDSLIYPNGQRKGTSYALIGYNTSGEELWKVTYAPTPGAANNYQEFKTCEEGKVINEATGNCVKVAAVTTKICPDGQYLNILTGRCKKYETTTEKTCKEGYYLNSETGRCRKIVENKGTNYGVEPEKFEEKSSFVGLYAIVGVVVVGLGYVVYEFRYVILKGWRKIVRR